MAGNKKPRKKFDPKKHLMRYPQLLNSFTAFLPVIKALETILEKKEIMVGPRGDYVYLQANGLMYSLLDEMQLYDDFITNWCTRNNRTFDMRTIQRFKTQLINKTGFDEEIVTECLEALKLFQRVFGAVPAPVARSITKTIKVKQEFERIEQEAAAANQ